METRNRNVAVEVKENINSADVPSGFILKLYEMVNGAPDDVISVSVPLPSIVGGSFNQAMSCLSLACEDLLGSYFADVFSRKRLTRTVPIPALR